MGGTDRDTVEHIPSGKNQCIVQNGEINPSSRNSSRPSPRPGADIQADAAGKVRQAPSVVMAKDDMSKTLLDASLLFVHDLKGDALISQYDGVDRSKVPRYRRAGRGRVLGSKGRLVLHHEGSRNVFSIRLGPDHESAKRRQDDLAARVAHFKSRTVRVRHVPTAKLDGPAEDFISLDNPRKRRRREESASEQESPNYRSIEGKAKEEDFLDNDLDYGSDSSADVSSGPEAGSALQHKVTELKKHLEKHPDDIDAWLERLDLQDEILLQARDGPPELTEAERQSQADVKVDMIQKALRKVTSGDASKLQVALLREGMRIWNRDKIDKKWEMVSKFDRSSLALFKLRLEVILTSGKNLTYRQVLETIESRIHLLRDEAVTLLHGDRLSQEGRDDNFCLRYQQILYLCLRATRFLLDFGYRELATAIWQGLLEVNFCRSSDSARLPPEPSKSSFAQFWESESPRLGEVGAKGCHDSTVFGTREEPKPPMTEKLPCFPQASNTVLQWGLREAQHDQDSKLPVRLAQLKGGQAYDPYRVVLYEDIQSFIFEIPEPEFQHMKRQLIDAFLIFCGLPPAFSDSENIQAALKDPFLLSSLDALEDALLSDHSFGQESRQRRSPCFDVPVARLAPSPELFFSGPNWFQYMSQSSTGGDCRIDQSWALSTVRQLVYSHGVEELAEYYLALECSRNPDKVKSVAKRLLRQYPSNIGLYRDYALVELANGKLDRARNVAKMAADLEGDGKLELYYAWAWIELEGKDRDSAALRLCQAAQVAEGKLPHDELTPTLILKTTRTLATTTDLFLSSGHHGKAVEHAQASVLFSYLTAPSHRADTNTPQQGNLAAALSAIKEFNDSFTSRFPSSSPFPCSGSTTLQQSLSHQRFLQQCSRLLYHHACAGPCRPAEIKESLLAFARTYPTNTLLLSMAVWADSSSAASNPLRAGIAVRELMDENFSSARKGNNKNKEDSPAIRAFAIHYVASTTSSPHAARAAFESALRSDVCAGCSELWKVYVRFVARHPAFRPGVVLPSQRRKNQEKKQRQKMNDEEQREQDVKPSRNELARQIFYRALDACPGVKKLAFEVFGSVQHDLADDEDEMMMMGVARQLVAWGVRLESDPDDFVKGLVGLNAAASSSSSSSTSS